MHTQMDGGTDRQTKLVVKLLSQLKMLDGSGWCLTVDIMSDKSMLASYTTSANMKHILQNWILSVNRSLTVNSIMLGWDHIQSKINTADKSYSHETTLTGLIPLE